MEELKAGAFKDVDILKHAKEKIKMKNWGMIPLHETLSEKLFNHSRDMISQCIKLKVPAQTFRDAVSELKIQETVNTSLIQFYNEITKLKCPSCQKSVGFFDGMAFFQSALSQSEMHKYVYKCKACQEDFVLNLDELQDKEKEICIKCGSRIGKDAKYCVTCGALQMDL